MDRTVSLESSCVLVCLSLTMTTTMMMYWYRWCWWWFDRDRDDEASCLTRRVCLSYLSEMRIMRIMRKRRTLQGRVESNVDVGEQMLDCTLSLKINHYYYSHLIG